MQDEVEQVFNRWKLTMGHQRARLDPKRAKAIRAMLIAGYSVEDLELAIFGCSISPFHQGQNDRGTTFDDIGLICRDAEHVDKFIKLAEKAAARKMAQAMPAAPRLMDRPATAVPASVMAMVKK
jgi:hypothetical protein